MCWPGAMAEPRGRTRISGGGELTDTCAIGSLRPWYSTAEVSTKFKSLSIQLNSPSMTRPSTRRTRITWPRYLRADSVWDSSLDASIVRLRVGKHCVFLLLVNDLLLPLNGIAKLIPTRGTINQSTFPLISTYRTQHNPTPTTLSFKACFNIVTRRKCLR